MTIYLHAETRRRIRIAASAADLSLSDFCARTLERALRGEGDIRTQWDEALREIDAFRQEVFERHDTHPDSAEMIRQMRRERDEHLDHVS